MHFSTVLIRTYFAVLVTFLFCEHVFAQASVSANSIQPQQAVSIGDVQNRLNQLGYDAGKADGVLGQRTKKATRSFQRDNNKPVTGILNQEELDLLFRLSDNSSSFQQLNNHRQITQQELCFASRTECVAYQSEVRKEGKRISQLAAVDVSSVPGLTEYIRENYRKPAVEPDGSSAILVDLDKSADGKEEIVLGVFSPQYCGSGGCHYEVLKRQADGSFKQLLGRSLLTGMAIIEPQNKEPYKIALGERIMREGVGWDIEWTVYAYDGLQFVDAHRLAKRGSTNIKSVSTAAEPEKAVSKPTSSVGSFDYVQISECDGERGIAIVYYWGVKSREKTHVFSDVCFNAELGQARFVETVSGLYLLNESADGHKIFEAVGPSGKRETLDFRPANIFDRPGSILKQVDSGNRRMGGAGWIRKGKFKRGNSDYAELNYGFMGGENYTGNLAPGEYLLSGLSIILSSELKRSLSDKVDGYGILGPNGVGKLSVAADGRISVSISKEGFTELQENAGYGESSSINLMIENNMGQLSGNGSVILHNGRNVGLRDNDWKTTTIAELEVRGRIVGSSGEEMHILVIGKGVTHTVGIGSFPVDFNASYIAERIQ